MLQTEELLTSNTENESVVLSMGDSIYEDPNLAAVIKSVEKTFGKGSIIAMGEKPLQNHEAISSGSFLIDQAIGIGGYPKGRIVEIFGPESSGKTTLALHAIAEAQKSGGRTAFIDAEHALDPKYAKNIGVNLDNLLVSQPDSGEQALDILEMLVKSDLLDVVVVDSVAALVPKAELDGEMSDQQIGMQARLMSKALRKLSGVISKTNTVVIFINQLREKVGVIFGSPEVTPGGRALRFYASVRMEIRRTETISQNGQAVANKVKVKIVKNKMAPPFKTVQIMINFNKGLDKISEILDLGVMYDFIQKSGVWYSFNNEKIGQGREAASNWLAGHPNVIEDIEAEIKKKLVD